jgi:hypothetical protein
MKLLLVTSSVLAVLLALPRAQEHEAPESELARNMEAIEDTLKVLRKNMKDDATRAQALAALAEIQRLSLACKGLVPSQAEKLPEAERAAFSLAYRRTMVDFLLRQLELEAALLDGNAEGAQLAFERFRDMEDAAHERFAPEDE